MRKNTMRNLLFGLILLTFTTSACAPRPVLIRQEIIGGKSVKHVLVLTHAEDDVELYDYIMRVCNYDGQDRETDCVDSVVLENVLAKSVY